MKTQTILGFVLSGFFGIYSLLAYIVIEFRVGDEQGMGGAAYGFFAGMAFLGGIWAILDARRHTPILASKIEAA